MLDDETDNQWKPLREITILSKFAGLFSGSDLSEECMGEIIRVSCNACDFEREAVVGVGMLGSGVELCPCYQCGRFVMKKVDHRNVFDGLAMKCPYCRKILKRLEDGDECAICSSSMTYEWLGEWD